jgi:hypothetical protein
VHVATAKYCLKLRNENARKNYKCDYCYALFTQKIALGNHLAACNKLKEYNRNKKLEEDDNLKKKVDDLTTEINELKKLEKIHQQDTNIIKNLTTENKKLKAKIAKLEETVTFGKGYIEGCKTVKPPKQITNNTTHNTLVQKLEALPITTIEPFTISLIKNNLENYTYEMYKRAELGVVEFITDLTILEMEDGTIEKNYVSSDRSRNAFHRLVVGKKWKSDGGASFLNIVLDQLIPKVNGYYDELQKEISAYGIREISKEVLIKKDTELRPFFYGVTGSKSKDRVVVLSKIRSVIKNNNHIDVLSIEQ